LIFALAASVYTNCILIVNRLEKRCLISTLTSAVSNVLLNLFLIPRYGAIGAAITTVVAEALNLQLQRFFARRDLELCLRISMKNICTVLTECLCIALICTIIGRIVVVDKLIDAFAAIMAAVIASGIVYILLLWFTKNELLEPIYVQRLKRRTK
jgi:O-antigen/teichoic acid export membrane protein